MKLIFATANTHKLNELKSLMPPQVELAGLAEAGISEDIPETADTLEGNALLKARYVFERTGLACFADDTGLEVHALGGRPGVYSARYAGEQKNADDNMNKLLEELEDKPVRTARFRTVIAFTDRKQEILFDGIVEGLIGFEKRGAKGFGYDPVFFPEHSDKTFAEMTMEEKNTMSHRARAVEKLLEFLRDYKG